MIIPLLQSQNEIAEYVSEMSYRMNAAKSLTVPFANQDSVLSGLDNIHIQVEEFCSNYLSMSDTQHLVSSKRLKEHCDQLYKFADRMLKEGNISAALKAWDEAGKIGDSYANRALLKHYSQIGSKSGQRMALYRLCSVDAVNHWHQMPKSKRGRVIGDPVTGLIKSRLNKFTQLSSRKEDIDYYEMDIIQRID